MPVTITIPYTTAELRQAADTLSLLLGSVQPVVLSTATVALVENTDKPAKVRKAAEKAAPEPASVEKDVAPAQPTPEAPKAASAPADDVPMPLGEVITRCARVDRQGTVALLQTFGGRKLSEVPESSHDELRVALMAKYGDKL